MNGLTAAVYPLRLLDRVKELRLKSVPVGANTLLVSTPATDSLAREFLHGRAMSLLRPSTVLFGGVSSCK